MNIIGRVVSRFLSLRENSNALQLDTASQTYTCHKRELPKDLTLICKRHEAQGLIRNLDESLVQKLSLDTETIRESLADLILDHKAGLTHFYCEPLRQRVFSAITIPQIDNVEIDHNELLQLGQHITDLIYGDGKERSITSFMGVTHQGELTFSNLLSKIIPRDPKSENATKTMLGKTIGKGSVIVISLVGDKEIKVGLLTVSKATAQTTTRPLITTINKAAAL